MRGVVYVAVLALVCLAAASHSPDSGSHHKSGRKHGRHQAMSASESASASAHHENHHNKHNHGDHSAHHDDHHSAHHTGEHSAHHSSHRGHKNEHSAHHSAHHQQEHPGHAHDADTATAAGSFTISNNSFYLNGSQFRILSGSLHYARVHPDYWLDRLTRMRAMGLNAVQTYVPWNWHNPQPGVYDWAGSRDLVQFIKTAQSVNLLVLLRAGPYICGEWDFGGFPSWLLAIEPPIKLRTYDTGYIDQVDQWWSVLLPIVEPYLIQNGGPIIMMQVENEFGSYGDVQTNPLDLQYMEHLVALARNYMGDELILYTTDGGDVGYMSRGTLNGSAVYSVGDFGPGSDPEQSFAAQKQFNAPGMSPNMCTEYYTGWLSHWGETMANTSTTEMIVTLDAILALDGSVNLYMAYGGTNFGFFAGANGGGGTSYQPTITSYDYDSPISEGGEHGYGPGGDKYVALQTVLFKYPQPQIPAPPQEPPLPPRTAFGDVNLTEYADFVSNLPVLASGTFTNQNATRPMEMYNQSFGYILYTTELAFPAGTYSLTIDSVCDRAHIFIDGELAGIINRTQPVGVSVQIKTGSTLLVLVEGMGRINYGGALADPKGIVGSGVSLDGEPVTSSWTVQTVPLTSESIAELKFAPATVASVPTFYQGTFIALPVADTYVYMAGWNKGMVWINGFNLGRFWQTQGPQQTLFVPAPVLVPGTNTIVVLELDQAPADLIVSLVDQPIFTE